MKQSYVCCFCGKQKVGYGNSTWPIYPDDKKHRCCDNCNWFVVIPERIKLNKENINKL